MDGFAAKHTERVPEPIPERRCWHPFGMREPLARFRGYRRAARSSTPG